MAFASGKVREILLFSSIAQSGLVVLIFLQGFVGWGVFLIVSNAVGKLILFMIANHASDELGTDDVSAFKGLFVNNKVVGLAFTVASLSAIGLPLFLGFVVKMNILGDLFAEGNYFIPAAILITSVVEGIYFVRLLMKLWYKENNLPVVKYEFILKYVVVVLAILIMLFGVYSAPVESSANDLDAYQYVEGGNL